MARKSAGIIVYRARNGKLEVLLGHLGGPYWANKDRRAWSFPKGEFEDEEPFEAALREFQEETGQPIAGNFVELKPLRQPGNKIVYAWAVEGDVDADSIVSNSFKMEWPPRSGKVQSFPELDRAAWFEIEEAKAHVHKGLVPIFEELQDLLRNRGEVAA